MHLGLTRIGTATLLALAGCGGSPDTPPWDASLPQDASRSAVDAHLDAARTDAAPGEVHDAAAQVDASPDASIVRGADGGVLCSRDPDCAIVPDSCCACGPTLDDTHAVLSSDAPAILASLCSVPVACAACPDYRSTTEGGQVIAKCNQGRCEALDTRMMDVTACSVDADCVVAPRSCCPTCSEDANGWWALRKGSPTPFSAPCDVSNAGDLSCPPCVDVVRPFAYCATDGHCAIRVERIEYN